MAMYEYTHPVSSAFTIPSVGDFHLHQGHQYELPEDNAHIIALVDQGYLMPVNGYVEQTETAPEPTPKSSRKSQNTQ